MLVLNEKKKVSDIVYSSFSKLELRNLICLIFLLEFLRRYISNPILYDVSLEIRFRIVIKTFERHKEIHFTCHIRYKYDLEIFWHVYITLVYAFPSDIQTKIK